jgi:hypothetical protein
VSLSSNTYQKIIVYFDLLGFDEQSRHIERIFDLPSEIARESIMKTTNGIIQKRFPDVIYKQTSLDSWMFLFEDLNSSFIVLNDLKTIFETEYSPILFESCIISAKLNTINYYLTDAAMTAVKTCDKYRKAFTQNTKHSVRNSFTLLHKDAYKLLNQEQENIFYRKNQGEFGFFGNDDATLINPEDYIINEKILKVDELKSSFVKKEEIEFIETDYMKYSFFAECINKCKKINLYLYTAETFVIENRDNLIKHPEITLKILIRNPFEDDKKRKQAIDSVNILNEISATNKKFKFSIKFYDHPPLLRAIIFDNKEGFLGIYRYDPEHQFTFYGIEENILLHVKDGPKLGTSLLKLYMGRFEYEWINSHSLNEINK